MGTKTLSSIIAAGYRRVCSCLNNKIVFHLVLWVRFTCISCNRLNFFQQELCSAVFRKGKTIDKAIERGLDWMMEHILTNWEKYSLRVEEDKKEQKEKEEQENVERKERVRRIREERQEKISDKFHNIKYQNDFFLFEYFGKLYVQQLPVMQFSITFSTMINARLSK